MDFIFFYNLSISPPLRGGDEGEDKKRNHHPLLTSPLKVEEF
jgi:hypothetical protein